MAPRPISPKRQRLHPPRRQQPGPRQPLHPPPQPHPPSQLHPLQSRTRARSKREALGERGVVVDAVNDASLGQAAVTCQLRRSAIVASRPASAPSCQVITE